LKEDPGTWPYYNDFLPVFLGFGPSKNSENAVNAGAYRLILEDLRKAGASFTGLSGSGSCCFGVFTAKETAENAEKTLSGSENFVKLTFFLAQNTNAILE